MMHRPSRRCLERSLRISLDIELTFKIPLDNRNFTTSYVNGCKPWYILIWSNYFWGINNFSLSVNCLAWELHRCEIFAQLNSKWNIDTFVNTQNECKDSGICFEINQKLSQYIFLSLKYSIKFRPNLLLIPSWLL